MSSPALNAREKAAVLWAEHVTLNTARERDDVFAEVARHFSDPEIVELTLMSGFFAMFNRFTDSLRIPVEIQEEVDKIQRSVHLDQRKVRDYLQAMFEAWPERMPEPVADA